MIRISKVYWPKMGMDYGWMFDIQSQDELFEYTRIVRKSKMEKEFREALRWQQGTGHITVLALLAAMRGVSLVDALVDVNTDTMNGMERVLSQTGRIFVNSKGGYFGMPDTEAFEVTKTQEISEWALPDEKPRIIQWPDGTHFYVKIGDDDILDAAGNQKWDTRAEAEKVIVDYLKKKK